MLGQPDMPGQHGEQSEGNAAWSRRKWWFLPIRFYCLTVLDRPPSLNPNGKGIADVCSREHLVKHFRVPSPNRAKSVVLNAFQEEGWPRARSVDDPLPPLS